MNIWKERNVLVTGVNGFVGAHLAKGLLDNGARVTGLIRDRIPNSALDLVGASGRINVVYGDAEDYDLLERAFNEYDIEAVFHLAAQSQVGVANRSPASTIKTNIMGTVNILEAARRLNNLKAIVVASSDKAYGVHKKLPYTEAFALHGTYPYDASKSAADILSQAYFHTYGLPVGIARCGNIFGPADLNLKRIVPDTVRALVQDAPPVIRSDGRYIRDYIYAADAVSAYIALAEALLSKRSGVSGEAFNFGAENPVSVLSLVNELIRISGKKLKPRILNIATGEIRKQYLSSAKARRILGWRPQWSLKEALRETYDWYKGYFEEAR